MSSVAMQSKSQRATAPPSSSSAAAAARQYAQQSPQNRDAYFANHSPHLSNTPPQSSRRQERQGDYHSSASPRSQPYPSPSADAYISPDSQAYHANRAQRRRQSNGTDQYDGPPLAPPRSSSQQPDFPTSSPTSTALPESKVDTSRHPRPNPNDVRMSEGRGHGRKETHLDTQRHGGSPAIASAVSPPDATSSRSRRSAAASPKSPQGTRGPRDPAQLTHLSDQARPDVRVASAGEPDSLSHQNSELISRVVVSNPVVDIAREEERMAEARPARSDPNYTNTTAGPGVARCEAAEDGDGRRRQDYSRQSSKRRDVQFGEYMLGQTLGEGEFGKVKLGWKKDGTVQVAIKLIRRESVATNPSRLPKIYREISILRELSHPNIVRLHEMVETERHIGIILEYASGGELFDYILNHRYLKDPAARRLFAQLVSGVGYLHKKGIVHRDLKLENLLLDRHRNIIITDFGFANTFTPTDELSDDIIYNLANRDFVKKYRLERQDERGMRKGDLMQTSCGSPCYAAPELVVSDSLYTGRKVDVWSCGVILYAMLAGYLPFDDDPANPEGDNINLLYKYITTTALTFPEYVTPHARDLLRRILVPDPRKRADLFEVARHSWLNEYHHVVSHITSSTTNIADIANSTVPSSKITCEVAQISKCVRADSGLAEQETVPGLARSASVREPARAATQAATPPIGALSHHPAKVAQDEQAEAASRQRRNVNRHTIQPEYVQPQSHTIRGEPSTATSGPAAPTRARGGSQGIASIAAPPAGRLTKPLPQEPSVANEATKVADYPSAPPIDSQQRMPPPTRPARDVPRSVSQPEPEFAFSTSQPPVAQAQAVRPTTGNAASSIMSRPDPRFPSRGSYGQPVAPTVEAANAQGRVTRPKNGRGYNISGPIPQHGPSQSISRVPVPIRNPEPPPAAPEPSSKAHHRRSSTLSGLGERLFGRSASVKASKPSVDAFRGKRDKKYPPTSMKEPFASPSLSRTSIDSKRSFSFGVGKKKSVDLESQQQPEQRTKRFSGLIPSTFSFRGLTGADKDHENEPESPAPQAGDFPQPPSGVSPGRPSLQTTRPSTGTGQTAYSEQSQYRGQGQVGQDSQYDRAPTARTNFSRPPQYPSAPPQTSHASGMGAYQDTAYSPSQQSRPQPSQNLPSSTANHSRPLYPEGFQSEKGSAGPSIQQNQNQNHQGRGVLQKHNRNFNTAYGHEQGPNRHEGSSGPARKVMDYFRRRKARADTYQ